VAGDDRTHPVERGLEVTSLDLDVDRGHVVEDEPHDVGDGEASHD